MAINLVNELRNTAKENRIQAIKEADEALASVSEFLQQEDKQTFGMLQYFGYSKVINEAQQKKETIERTAAQARTLKALDCLTKEDIRKVCEKYYLKFLPAEQYNMPVPLHALEALKEFAKTTQMGRAWGPSSGIDPDKLFMIAPPSHFKLFERPIPEDPILLYEIEEGIYVLIVQWGNDFTFVRRIYGIVNQFIDSGYTIVATLALIILTIVQFWNSMGNGDAGVVLRMFLVILGFIGFWVILYIISRIHMEYDSPYKQ